MFGTSEDIIQTFTDILNLRCNLNRENRHPIFSHNTLAYDDVQANQI